MSAHKEKSCCREALNWEEKKLLECVRELGFGEITVKVKNGKPVMGHRAVADIKFTR